ncbi:MAG: radical SAM protein [candidate division KSB1 bacterium]|nr:radical SAM protein [candidate division KSB1 bacterium]MDZ7368599.1 radical SAM protein [candidate division KSB1 bacterium]MDZ7406364.1 radical SAM protein [candidate division KSB1 bacterium]
MAKVTIPSYLQAEQFQISPDYVRISMAAAIELRLKPGRLLRDCHCGCINLLQNYPEGCYANCTYCGLARERPGVPEDNTFIRVAWPLYPTDLVAEKIAEKEARSSVGRVCIAQVQDHRAYDDLIDMTLRIRRAARLVPISALVSATTLNEERLYKIKEAGADIVGVGLDAASEEVFYNTRGKGARSPHDWEHHWQIIRAARRIFGPMKVNCHIIVGLGETDRELVDLFYQLKSEQIAGYLFSFNPEPGTAMQEVPRAPIQRWRRIQLVKYLIENYDLPPDAIEFDAPGNIARLDAPDIVVDAAIDTGLPFMTNGCPDRDGVMACNRPYGSYRPGEEYRDYPFVPNTDDLVVIRKQMKLDEVWAKIS